MGGVAYWCRERYHCEHVQALLTNNLPRHWEWQEDRRVAWVPGFFKYQTALVASLDVKAAFDVAQPSVVSKLLQYVGGLHGHVVAALLEEVKDVCFENCETEFRYSQCIRQGRAVWRLHLCGTR